MNDNALRPALAHAREAADEFLMRKVADGSMDPRVAKDLALTGFTATTRTLSHMRVKGGMSEADITAAYRGQLNKARRTGDAGHALAAEFTLAVWGGMLADLADWLGTTAG
jgi:hypothetical protein